MHPKLRLFQSHQQQDDKNIRGPRKQEQQAMNDLGPSIGATTSSNNNNNIGTEGLGRAVGGVCLLLLLLGSSFHVHACHPRGVLYAHWVCRVFSGPWD